ncbi:MAG TPA: hypothetical protein VMB22_04565 [Verrucomicrobiae bacterium]|nr:hypothetical protein [Verrucomicrobiae bacterium]
MKSINIKLLLPDVTHDLIVERAKAEGVELAHYCSSLITESLGNSGAKMPTKLPFEPHGHSPNGFNGLRPKLPDTIEQILAVFRLVQQNKMDFTDAVRKVAKDLGIRETTVRDKCTRRISLPHAPVDTDQFLDMLVRPNALRDYLCHRFPKFSREIAQRFGTTTPEALP